MNPAGIPPYVRSFVGHSNNPAYRQAGSSGGVGTTILAHLLHDKTVDAVIGAGFDPTDKTRPIFRCITNADDVLTLSGSKYVYLEFASLAALIDRHRHLRLAVVAPPCFCTALRQSSPNIHVLISFFCGYNITPDATRYLLNKARTTPHDVINLNYRGGLYPGGFTVTLKDGSQRHFGKEYYEAIDLMFLRRGCSHCRFFISATADIVLGDAWIKGAKKETTILAINATGDALIKKMFHSGDLTLFPLTQDELYRMHKHNLHYKTLGHSLVMKLIVTLFNNPVARYLAPIHLLAQTSKLRRSCVVGISKDLKPIETYPL